MTAIAPLYGPLRACSYALGVFPFTVSQSTPHKFRLHWFGVALKAVHLLLFWSAGALVFADLYRMYPSVADNRNRQALDKKLATTSPVKVYELYLYMTFTTSTTSALCQVHMLQPSIVALVGECLLWPRVHRGGGHVWPPFKAFTIIAFIIYEFIIYLMLSILRFNHRYLICLFWFLSSINCIVVEQFFYITCLTLYVRLKRINEEVQDLVDKAEHPRWRCWASPADRHPAHLGIPAFGASDIRHLRSAHMKATETFSRVNRAFQLPLLLNMIDSVCRIVFYTSEVTYHLTYVIWDKRTTITYLSTVMYSGFWGMRIVRLWYLHSCEYYVTKMIILFQNQLDAINSKFQIYGMININIAFFYAGFGLLMAYIIFLLQFFGSSLQPSLVPNNFTGTPSIIEVKNRTNAA